LEKATTDAIHAKEQGCQQGRSETLVYLREALLTLIGKFQDDRYFEAYLRFVDECEQAAVEGHDPKEMEFVPPSEGEVAEDEATNPLEAEASASEKEGREDGGDPDM